MKFSLKCWEWGTFPSYLIFKHPCEFLRVPLLPLSASDHFLNLLSHGCRQKLVTLSWVSGKGISPPESTSTPLLYLCALISWQFLNFPPTMEILLAIIAHPIYPLPQTFSNFARERKITPGLQLFFCFWYHLLWFDRDSLFPSGLQWFSLTSEFPWHFIVIMLHNKQHQHTKLNS